MQPVRACPACGIPLGLFTPREITAHVNACLDAQSCPSPPHSVSAAPTCAVCTRDLSSLTPAAQVEHANRCADTTLPLGREILPQARPAARLAAPRSAGDPRVARLLQLLGLERYAARFASEEIDLAALRLLGDDDFALLRIPDSARRHIAEAMHSVPILAQIEATEIVVGGSGRGANDSDGEAAQVPELEGEKAEEDIVATQQFRSSRLGQQMSRIAPLLGDESSEGDEDFRQMPSPVLPAVKSARGAARERCAEGTSDSNQTQHPSEVKLKEGSEAEERNEEVMQNQGQTEKEVSKGERDDRSSLSSRGHREGLMIEGASSLPSDADAEASDAESLSAIERELTTCSQISLEARLRSWRLRRERLERSRHKRAMERIRSSCEKLQKRICTRPCAASESPPPEECISERIDDVANLAPAPIDLTLDVSDDDEIRPAHTPRRFRQQEPHGTAAHSIFVSSGSMPRKRRGKASLEDSSLRPVANQLSDASEPTYRHVEHHPKALPLLFNDSEDDGLVPSQAPNKFKAPNQAEDSPDRQLPCSQSNTSPAQKECPHRQHRQESPLPYFFDNEVIAGNDGPTSVIAEEEEVLDLIESGEDDVLGQNDLRVERDLNCILTQVVDVPGVEDGQGSQPEHVDGPTGAKPRSRLKKARKVSTADILNAIRLDKGLYDDILMIEAVPFERILESVRASGVNVSKKALTELLQKEGVSFKPEVPKDTTNTKQYFMRLSCDLG